MTQRAVLHHVGSPSRIYRTIEFVHQTDAVILFGMYHEDVDIARRANLERVVCGDAKDTVGEALAVRREIRRRGITELYISTEKGHLFRAWIVSVILHAFTGVTVRKIPHPVDDGYQSPIRRTFIDMCRALWHRVTND